MHADKQVSTRPMHACTPANKSAKDIKGRGRTLAAASNALKGEYVGKQDPLRVVQPCHG